MNRHEEKSTFNEQIDVVIGQVREWTTLPANPRDCLMLVTASPSLATLEPKIRTRSVIFQSDLLELVLMSWGPGSASCIHGHGGSQCYMRVLSGSLTETRHRPFEVDPVHESVLPQGTCAYIHDGASFHRLSSETGAISLHLYSKPLHQMQAFDEEKNEWLERATNDLA